LDLSQNSHYRDYLWFMKRRKEACSNQSSNLVIDQHNFAGVFLLGSLTLDDLCINHHPINNIKWLTFLNGPDSFWRRLRQTTYDQTVVSLNSIGALEDGSIAQCTKERSSLVWTRDLRQAWRAEAYLNQRCPPGTACRTSQWAHSGYPSIFVSTGSVFCQCSSSGLFIAV